MATELGKAYVQIIPSAQGISGKISNLLKGESQSAGTIAGGLIGTKLISKLKTIIAAAGIGKAISASISEGAKLQQSIGGVETLFKESAGKVRDYAREAYKTSGVSANEYMEGVTSFAASLLQSTAGNTQKAAEVSDMAFRDMSDNANKMGSNMGDIQNAYQGFAKQNYTMLDNLKLGYGGTKKEMERLLKDAQEITGVKYDINNLSDVYQAIHAIQGKLDITGTTAKEAATTVSGSFGQMKAAFKNVLGNLAIGENVKQSFADLAVTVKTFVFDNLIPMVLEIFKNIPAGLASFATTMGPMLMQEGTKLIENLSQGFTTGFPMLITKAGEIITNLISGFTQNAPQLIQSGVELIKNLMKGLIDNIPLIIAKAGEIVLKLVEAIITVAPQLLSAGIELATNLSKGLWEKTPEILAKLGEFLVHLVKLIVSKAPEFLAKGKELITKLKEGMESVKEAAKQAVVTIITAIIDFIASKTSDFLTKGKELIDKVKEGFNAKKEEVKQAVTNIITVVIDFIKSKAGEFLAKGKELIDNLKKGFNEKKEEVVSKAREIIKDAKDAVAKYVTDFVKVGSDIIAGIVKGIGSAAGAVRDAVVGAVGKAKTAAKKVLKIGSPSKVFAKDVGRWIPAGIAKGITGNLKVVESSMLAMVGAANNPTVKKEISKIVPRMKDKIKTDAPTLYEAGTKIANKIKEGIANKQSEFNNTGKNLVNSLEKGVKDKTNNLLSTVKDSADKSVETLKTSCADFTVAGQQITIALKEGIGSNGITIIIQIGDIMKDTVDKIKSYDGKLHEEGKNAVEKIKEGAKSKKSSLVQTIKNMMESALNTAKSIGQKFNSVFGGASGAVATVGKQAINQFVGGGPLGTVAKTFANTVPLGKSVGQGFSKGVQKQTPQVVKKFQDMGNKAINKFKNMFGIHSPSKVFYEFGSYIAEGLALGIGDNFNLVHDALGELNEMPAASLNKRFKVSSDYSKEFASKEAEDKSINLNLSIGGQNFKALVDRISLEQNKDIELKLAY